MKPKINIRDAGKCICEKYEDSGIYLVMYPDGRIATAPGRTDALGLCRRWFKRNCGTEEITAGQIEWR